MGYVVEMNSIAFLIIFFIFDIIQFREYGLNMVLLNMLISATIVIVGYFLWRYRLGDLYYHERSRWKMDKDQVLRRLAKAMAARGARPQLETKDENMWFLLPPLSIVVGRAYVGPSTEENEHIVERLKGFVENALA